MSTVLNREQVVAYLNEHLTTENIDVALEYLLSSTKFPKALAPLKFIAKMFVFAIKPEKIVVAIDKALISVGL